jgi:hypothetical protein
MADRYWVGGTASWDGTAGTKWALTSGGAGGQTVPTSADDVFFTNLSTGTCTIATGNTGAKSINCTGFTGTLAGSAAISVSGSITLVAGMTYTYTGSLSVIGTGTLTSASKTLGPVTINGSGITVTLGDNCTMGTTRAFTLTAGTIDLAGFTLSTGSFVSSNSSARSIAFGSGNIALTSTAAAAVVLDMATATNFTFTGTGGFTRNQAATATVRVGNTAGGSATASVNLTVDAGASALTITSTSHFRSLILTGSTCTVTGTVTIYSGGLALASGGTYTSFSPIFAATQTFDSLGKTVANGTVNGAGITVTLGGAFTTGIGNTFTLTAGALALNGFNLTCGIFSSNNSNTRSIAFGSSNIILTSPSAGATILSAATASNFTWTGTGGFVRDQTAATSTVTWGTSSGSAASSPNFTVNAGASALTITATSRFNSINFTGSTCAVTGTARIYAGGLTLASGGDYTAFTPVFSATQTFDSNGKTIGDVTVDVAGITLTLGSTLTVSTTGIFNLTNGSIDLNGFTLKTGAFESLGSNTRSIAFGTSNIELTSLTSSDDILVMSLTNFSFTGTGAFFRDAVIFGIVTVDNGTSANSPNFILTGTSQTNFTSECDFKNVDLSGATGILSGFIKSFGDVTLGATGDYDSLAIAMCATGTLTSNGGILGDLDIGDLAGNSADVTCADAITLSGDLSFDSGTLKLKAGTTNVVDRITTFGTTLKYLESTTPGVQATIFDTTGTNTVTYLSIKDSNATGGAVFNALSTTNIDAGNNTGWLGFGGTNMFLVF